MKKIKLVLLVVCLVVGISWFSRAVVSFCQEEDAFSGKITADNVRIRTGYNKNFTAICCMNKDDCVMVVGKNCAWYKIILPEKTDCFVHAEFVKIVNNAQTLGITTADKLNVRGGPDVTYDILGQLEKGTEIVIKEKKDNWYKIFPQDNIYGWIHEDYVVNDGQANGLLLKRKSFESTMKQLKELEKDYNKALLEKNRPSVLKAVLVKLNMCKEKHSESREICSLINKHRYVILKQIKKDCFSKTTVKSAPKDKTVEVEIEGRIQELGNFLGKKGTHKLTEENSGIMFFLKSEKINLDDYSNRPVHVSGFIEKNADLDAPLLIVEKVNEY